MDRLDEMYESQGKLQELINGYPLDVQSEEQRIANIKENYIAIVQELGEMLNETGWKSWATSRHINRSEYKKEIIDSWHFLMNLMLHVGMTPDDLYRGYLEKRAINERRQRTGYDGVSTKMPCCQRAVEDVSFTEVRKLDGSLDFIICVCGDRVDGEFIKRNAEMLPDLQ